MKKIYKFYFNEQSYILKENEEDRFVIPRDTLEFNGNEFYQNLFKEYSFEDKIEIVTLRHLTQASVYVRVSFSILLGLSLLYGILELIFQNYQTPHHQRKGIMKQKHLKL